MGTLLVTGTAAGGPSISRKKPRRAVSGRRRHAITRLLHYVNIVLNADEAEQTRADNLGYVPFLFTIRPSANEAKAMKNVKARCAAMLAATLQ